MVASGEIAVDAPLDRLTTYRLGGPARYYLEAEDVTALTEAGRHCAAAAIPVLVLGRGSNLVISDGGFDGLVVRLGKAFSWTTISDGEVTAGAATSLPAVARAAAKEGRGGLEFLVGIPGSVGGAVRMNAGCHGSETAGWLITAGVVDLDGGTVTDRTPEQLELGYRRSSLKPHEVVVEARFRSIARAAEEVEATMREITRWRREHQPGGTLNAGSVFANPPDDAAGRIIDALGLKGFSVGGASVSEKHANFFVADPGTRAQDVYDLVWEVRRRVGESTGVWLRPEIQFAGSFRPPPAGSRDDG